MNTYECYSPVSLEEVLAILKKDASRVKVLAGGTDILVQLLEGKKRTNALLDISRIDELRYIKEEGNMIRIGALATHREVERAEPVMRHAPLLREALFLVASPQLRNTATLAGNVVNASPVADSVPPLMVLDALLTLKSADGERKVMLRKFTTGPGATVMKPDELMSEVSFRKLGPSEVSFYERLGQRRLLSISKVGVAFRATVEKGVFSQVRIALGAVAPRVIMAPETAAFLEGKEYSPAVVRDAARIAEKESRAITDIRSSETYRNKMAGALLIRGLARVME